MVHGSPWILNSVCMNMYSVQCTPIGLPSNEVICFEYSWECEKYGKMISIFMQISVIYRFDRWIFWRAELTHHSFRFSIDFDLLREYAICYSDFIIIITIVDVAVAVAILISSFCSEIGIHFHLSVWTKFTFVFNQSATSKAIFIDWISEWRIILL